MDNNISDLLNKALSNPEMMNKITTLLPVVSSIIGGESNRENKKIVETTVLPDKTSSSEAQPPPSAPVQNQISIEHLIADENVISAFKNLITAINSAQNGHTYANNSSVPDAADKESKLGELLSSLTGSKADNTDKSDAVSASALGNILGSLLSSQQKSNTDITTSEDETSETLNDGGGNVEKALESLTKLSAVTGPEKDERVRLLLALKPFLKDERQGKVDTAIKYMSVAKILNVFGKNGFV